MAELSSTLNVKIEMDEELKLAIETFKKRIEKLEQEVNELKMQHLSMR